MAHNLVITHFVSSNVSQSWDYLNGYSLSWLLQLNQLQSAMVHIGLILSHPAVSSLSTQLRKRYEQIVHFVKLLTWRFTDLESKESKNRTDRI